jgi:hypothetical protein
MVLLFVCMSSRKLGTENRRSPVALLMVCLSLAWSEPLFRSRAALSMMLLRGARKDQQHFSIDVEKYRGGAAREKKQGFGR